MTSTANSMALGQGTDRPVSPVSDLLTERSAFFSGLFREVRGAFGGRKVAEQLAEIWGCDVRSAGRYLAGERVPGGNEITALLWHPVIGPIVLAFVMRQAAARLAAADFARFELEMVKATVRADVRARNSE